MVSACGPIWSRCFALFSFHLGVHEEDISVTLRIYLSKEINDIGLRQPTIGYEAWKLLYIRHFLREYRSRVLIWWVKQERQTGELGHESAISSLAVDSASVIDITPS